MIDRLVHHTEILSLKGDSYRLRDRDLGGSPPAREPETAEQPVAPPARSPQIASQRSDPSQQGRKSARPPYGARRSPLSRPPASAQRGSDRRSPEGWVHFQPARGGPFSIGLDTGISSDEPTHRAFQRRAYSGRLLRGRENQHGRGLHFQSST